MVSFRNVKKGVRNFFEKDYAYSILAFAAVGTATATLALSGKLEYESFVKYATIPAASGVLIDFGRYVQNPKKYKPSR